MTSLRAGIVFFLGALLLTAGFLITAPQKKDSLEAAIARMPLEEKIGQLLIVGFEHPYVDDHIREMIARYRIGGINLLGRNVENETQITELLRELQTLNASRASPEIPLFIAADQEGGPINRFPFLKELTPQPQIISASSAESIAFARGAELKALGVNMNFSPLADYLTDPKSYLWSRVFHGTPEDITVRGEAMVRGYLRAGIIPVLKHFPGYGNVALDPHASGTVLVIDQTTLAQNLLPFQKIIEGGNAEMVMTAHITIPSVDPKPATYSWKFLTDILRAQWGFDGVIATDDLEMASAGGDVGAAALEALHAGADMLIITPTPEKQLAALTRLMKAVKDGEILESRVDESLRRILALKAKLQKTTP